MEYICGYFDTQGFRIDGKYIPAEIAFLGPSEYVCLRLKITPEVSPQSSRSVSYLTEFHHGLDYYSSGGLLMTEEELGDIIKGFYDIVKTCDSFLIACKSAEAENLLRQNNIPRINLISYGATSNNIKEKGRLPCIFHKIQHCNIRCASNNVIMLRQWTEKKLSKK